MKKLIATGLALLLLCSCSSPGNSSSSGVPSSSGDESSQPQSNALVQTEDNITYTITKAELIPVVGEWGENKEYFILDGEETKASEWNQLNITCMINNDTDAAFGYIVGANVKLADGYKLKQYGDISDLDLKQIPSHSQKEVTFTYYVESSLSPEKVTLTYSHMDYNEEYWQDLGKVITGELDQKGYEEKYGNAKELVFEIPIPYEA